MVVRKILFIIKIFVVVDILKNVKSYGFFFGYFASVEGMDLTYSSIFYPKSSRIVRFTPFGNFLSKYSHDVVTSEVCGRKGNYCH